MDENPNLPRDIQAVLRSPEFKRLKRHVYADFREYGESQGIVTQHLIITKLRDALMEFDPELGV